jgi:hypothetical protein
VHSELWAHSCAPVPASAPGQLPPSATAWHTASPVDVDPQQTCPPKQSQAFWHWMTTKLSPLVQPLAPPSSFDTQDPVPPNKSPSDAQQSCVRKSHVAVPHLPIV